MDGGDNYNKKTKKLTEEQKQRIEDNHLLIYHFLRINNLSIDEYYDIAAIGMCQASMTYQEHLSSFSTYAFKCMKSMVLREMKKKKRQKEIPENQIISYYTTVVHDKMETPLLHFLPSSENIEDIVLYHTIIQEYVNGLSERDKKIFQLLLAGYSQREISRRVHCSIANVSRVKRKIFRELTERRAR